MNRWIASVLLVGAVVAAARGADRQGVPAAQPPGRKVRLRKIVFSSDRSGPWRIWVAGESGSPMRQLTRAPEGASDVDPSFSPDGKNVLFTSTRGGKAGIWRVPLVGGPPTRICDGDQAEWAPDGRRIALRRKDAVIIRELKGGKEREVAGKRSGLCSGPSWSPDGKTIAFAARRGRANAIWLVPAVAGPAEARKLYDKKGACEPHFSPDGKRIVYETETHICTVGTDGRKNRLITYYGGLQRYPRFSPDGKQIIFCQGASTRGPWELYVVPATGGPPRKITDGGSDMYPDWK